MGPHDGSEKSEGSWTATTLRERHKTIPVAVRELLPYVVDREYAAVIRPGR